MGGGGTGGQHGGLVQKIIDSQKQYTGTTDKQVWLVWFLNTKCQALLFCDICYSSFIFIVKIWIYQEDKGPLMSQAAKQKERALTKKEVGIV